MTPSEQPARPSPTGPFPDPPTDAPTDPCRPVEVVAADGARVRLSPHGGQLLGWVPAGGGPDRLWTSPLARCGPGEAIRGGVPVVFPQFAARGPLPKHGVVRDRAWHVEPGPSGADEAVVVASLADDAGTRAVWPHAFRLTLTARARGDRLDVTLDVENPGDAPWSFAAALHAYFATSDAGRATVTGLGGLPAEDNAAAGAAVLLPDGPLVATGPRDVAVPAVPGPVVLDDPALGRLVVEAEGLPDRVLWNPGAAHGLGDVPPGGESAFVCVEPAVLDPVTLPAGGAWRGVVRLVATPPA